MKRPLALTTLLLTLLFLASYSLTAQASAPAQFSTPTPLPDGRIIYIVQPGDSCFRISAITGIPIEQLRSLNRLGEDCPLREGQELLLGIGGPSGAAPTPEPEATPTPGAPPTPTPPPGQARICIVLYNDVNGDALRQDTEILVSNGALSISGASGQFSQTANTVGGTDPLCFESVPEGSYNISVAAPDGYNATTQLNHTVVINAGEQVEVIFGVQQAVAALPAEPNEDGGSGPGNLLGILGIGLLLAGAGLGVYAWRFYGRKPMYNK
jgi:hypothetical protein